MAKINLVETPIEGLIIVEPTVFKDERGYFSEIYHQRELKSAGLDVQFVQENQSESKRGVLRGLHYQKQYPQGKLARVLQGSIFDVAVDLREGSKSFGAWYGIELSADNHRQLYIPEGFAHGFLTLSETAVFCYKCTQYHHPGDEFGIKWNDPAIAIEWPVNGNTLYDGTPLTISEKDLRWPGL